MTEVDVAIVGAGFGGLCAAIRLREAGLGSVLILERAQEVGGTWRDNTYPGCACDVPSHLYSLSFAPNADWTRPYPTQGEIQAYILRVVEQYRLRPLIRFGAAVDEARWDAATQRWQLRLQGSADGPPDVVARHVILATGPLNKPVLPDVAGLDSFEGVAFHSAQWRHDVPLVGKRVAVVGTGASAVQIVPEIAVQAAHVDVFQRTPAWVVPRWDAPYGPLRRWLYRHVPGLQRLSRWRGYWFNELVGMGFMGSKFMQDMLRRLALYHLRAQVGDEALRRTLTPDFNPGCKRLLISNAWYPALQLPQVQLVTQAVTRVEPQGLVGSDGRLHPCDVIIWATGFKATEFVAPMRVIGEDGTDLSARWHTQPAATRLGITVAGCPNLYMLVGPNTGLGHNSIVFMIEAQVNYIVGALRHLRVRGATTLRLRPDVQADSYAEMQRRMRSTVWASGCHSWYQTADGRIDTLWPGYTWQYWLHTRRFEPANYDVS